MPFLLGDATTSANVYPAGPIGPFAVIRRATIPVHELWTKKKKKKKKKDLATRLMGVARQFSR